MATHRVLALASGFALALAIPTLAFANVGSVTATNGTPLDEKIHDAGFPSADPGDPLIMHTLPSDYLVDYTSSSILDSGGFENGNGFAQVFGDGGANGAGFLDLTIDPENPVIGFTELKFKLDHQHDPDTLPKGSQVDYSFSTKLFYTDNTFEIFTGIAFGGDNRYLAAGNGKVISKLTIYDLVGAWHTNGKDPQNGTFGANFDAIKQVSFNAKLDPCFVDPDSCDGGGTGHPVPEPATWALMIVGFGGVGALIRRRRESLA